MTDLPVVAIAAGSEDGARPLIEVVRRCGGAPRLLLSGDGTSGGDQLRGTGGLVLSDYGPLELLQVALERNMPVLAIGGGMQALNVALGGGTGVDLAGHGPSQKDGAQVSSYHHIYIAPGSKLAAIVGAGGFVRVNSRHYRGIREAQKSDSLLASAYSVDDGVIEAVESPDHNWVIGVQFRPERPREVPPHFDRLFQGLVERAENKGLRRGWLER